MAKSRNQYTHPWTEKEEDLLKNLWETGVDLDSIAGHFPNRTRIAIKKRVELRRFKRRDKVGGLNPELKMAAEIDRPETYILLPNKLQKIVLLGDSHIPFDDKITNELVLRFLKDFQPDYIIIGGDIVDFYQISKFRKSPLNKTNIEEDIDSTHKFLYDIRNILQEAKIFYIEGNHEFRWRKYIIDNAAIFYNLLSLKFTELLMADDLDITYFPCSPKLNKFSHNYIQINNEICIGHFDRALKNACYSGRMLRDEFGTNIIQFHGHKIGTSYRRYVNGIRFGAEVGCLCGLEPDYIKKPDWQQGIAIIYIKDKDFSFYNIPIKNHSFTFNGKVYKK